jgi:RNA polymerase sigma-70 factor, ECF subfamily
MNIRTQDAGDTSASRSDSDLVGAIRDSDAKAFKSLYYRYHDPLFRYVWYRTHSPESAKDTLQEIFTRLWQNRRSLDPEKSIKAYLYRIAHNLLVDNFRKEGREKSFRTGSRPQVPGTTEGDADMRMDVQSAIDSLPDDLRIAFMLNRYQALKYAEIAEVCGVSVKTVESRIGRALDLLRKKLSV